MKNNNECLEHEPEVDLFKDDARQIIAEVKAALNKTKFKKKNDTEV